jgi:hypothetical protein
MKRSAIALVLFAAALAAAGPAGAQALRTWISGVGDDVNPCSRTAPCHTFAGAISKTAAGGEIDALDPAGFGSVTITKSITLDGGFGQNASILASGGANGILINAVGANVSIRNLSIQGTGTGVNGIYLVTVGSLHIEHCIIANFTGDGIHLTPNSAAQIFVDDTISRGNVGSGLSAAGTTASLRVSIFNSRFPDNGNGVFAGDFTKITARSSDASGNTMWGIVALGAGGPATVNVADTGVSNNVMGGLTAGGGALSSVIRMSNVSISGNGVGTATGTNGVIASFGNNYNSNTGRPTTVIAPQ